MTYTEGNPALNTDGPAYQGPDIEALASALTSWRRLCEQRYGEDRDERLGIVHQLNRHWRKLPALIAGRPYV